MRFNITKAFLWSIASSVFSTQQAFFGPNRWAEVCKKDGNAPIRDESFDDANLTPTARSTQQRPTNEHQASSSDFNQINQPFGTNSHQIDTTTSANFLRPNLRSSPNSLRNPNWDLFEINSTSSDRVDVSVDSGVGEFVDEFAHDLIVEAVRQVTDRAQNPTYTHLSRSSLDDGWEDLLNEVALFTEINFKGQNSSSYCPLTWGQTGAHQSFRGPFNWPRPRVDWRASLNLNQANRSVESVDFDNPVVGPVNQILFGHHNAALQNNRALLDNFMQERAAIHRNQAQSADILNLMPNSRPANPVDPSNWWTSFTDYFGWGWETPVLWAICAVFAVSGCFLMIRNRRVLQTNFMGVLSYFFRERTGAPQASVPTPASSSLNPSSPDPIRNGPLPRPERRLGEFAQNFHQPLYLLWALVGWGSNSLYRFIRRWRK